MTIYPDDRPEARYRSLSSSRRLQVTRLFWRHCQDGAHPGPSGKSSLTVVAGITSDGGEWRGRPEEFWDEWMHEDLCV